MNFLCKAFRKFRGKVGLYDLRSELAKWVEKNFGKEYVEEALDNYDKIQSGVPMGGFVETAVFLDLIERVKSDFAEAK